MATERIELRAKIAEARNVLGEVISRARYAGETTVLINRGKEAAVIVPFDFYSRALAALDERPVQADFGLRESDGPIAIVEVKSTHRPKGR
jgi:prevent-host-death family protein